MPAVISYWAWPPYQTHCHKSKCLIVEKFQPPGHEGMLSHLYQYYMCLIFFFWKNTENFLFWDCLSSVWAREELNLAFRLLVANSSSVHSKTSNSNSFFHIFTFQSMPDRYSPHYWHQSCVKMFNASDRILVSHWRLAFRLFWWSSQSVLCLIHLWNALHHS